MAATTRAFLISRFIDLSLKPLQPPPPPHLLIRPLLPSSSFKKRRPSSASCCLVSGVDGGGVSDDYVSTRKSGFDREFSVISNMLKKIEPLDTSVISKGVSDSAKDSMKQTISTMLGLLPSDQFSVTVRVSKRPLDRLLMSSIITGYTLWNAEYRISLMRNFDISTSDWKRSGFPGESEISEVKREESEGGAGQVDVDCCIEDLESVNLPSLGDLSPKALNYIQQLESELSSAKKARIHSFLEKTKKNILNQNPEEGSDTVGKEQQKLRKKVTILMKKQKVQQVRQIVKRHEDIKPWGQDAQVKVGCRLIQLLMETAYIQPPVDQLGDGPPDIRPAFIHTLKTITKETQKFSRRYGVIECDPLVRKGLEKTARHMVIPYMPMLVPPLNWAGYDRGAYLFLPSYIMRTHGAKQQRDAVKRTPKKQLEPVFEALNTLGSTKWRVNKRVLGIIDRIWASGGRLADLVDREDVPLPKEIDTEDEAEIRKWKWKVKSVKKENSERHSQRCDIELKLAVARKMKDENGFFYPHNLDFRGRAYPMHPYLNHLGSDLCRGILEFAEGRPLGKSGLRWLKIHMANLYAGGVDKFSYEGRIAFTENHLDDIFDSADRPLEGRRWWLGAEDPFQCLATCINLAEALRSSSPETTISYMPVHQDGSCNGLQHYAALGRDKLGAAAVNLVAGEKPADVYSGIAARVLDIMRRDAEKDPATDPNASRARLLISQVDRKLVKQTVMTSVYGVTYIGARDQIKKRLKDRCAIEDDDELFAASCYAAKTTLTALGEMFEAARSIMSWLGDCAKIIASENHPVRWTTPLGLPVVQPYRKLGRHLIKTSLQILTLQRETDMVMAKRQRTAFPPNFVHSLDGSHMMMTAVACKEAGLNFAGVHDSYWTHACDVDQMNRILREKFVELYEAPILENLLESFQKSFPTLNFPPLPERGNFDLREVLESPYFFN